MRGFASGVFGTVILAISLAGAPAQGDPPASLDFHEDLVLGLGEDVLLGQIWDVDVDGAGDIYLLDGGFKTVHKFSEKGEFLRDLGREGEAPGEFWNPLCLAAGPDGRIYVGGNSTTITVLEADGTPADSIKRERSGMVRSLCFDTRGDLYVCAFDRAERTMVHKYAAPDYSYERSFAAPYGEGHDIDPRVEGVYAVGYLSPGPEGGIYYEQMVPQLVQVFDADGRLEATHYVRSNRCELPEPEITENGMNFNARFAGGMALEALPGGGFLTVLWVPENEDKGSVLIDVYDGKGTLTHTRSQPDNFGIQAMDAQGRVYVCEERENVPVVVRYRVKMNDVDPEDHE